MEQLSPVLGHVFGDPKATGVDVRGVWLLPTRTAWTRFRIDGRENMIYRFDGGRKRGLGLLYVFPRLRCAGDFVASPCGFRALFLG